MKNTIKKLEEDAKKLKEMIDDLHKPYIAHSTEEVYEVEQERNIDHARDNDW